MVVGAAEDRQQRILLKRERAKQQNSEEEKLRSNDVKEKEQAAASGSENIHTVQEIKKPKLEEIPDGKAIIANVYHFLKEEYKFLKMTTMDNPQLQSLAPISYRTAEATGIETRIVRKIVKQNRMRLAVNKRMKEGRH